MFRRLYSAFFATLVCLTGLVGLRVSEARNWQRSGTGAAQDYLFISDTRPSGEIAMVFWLAPPMVPPEFRDARDLLSRYVVIGMSLTQVTTSTGLLEAKTYQEPVLTIGSGAALSRIAESKYPPVLAGAVATMGSMFSQALGPAGRSMSYRVYEAQGVNACQPGELRVAFAGETYSFKTPVPGCDVRPG